MLRFTIRDLLWLMVVVGMAIGWFLRARQDANAIQAEVDAKNRYSISLSLLKAEMDWRMQAHNEYSTRAARAEAAYEKATGSPLPPLSPWQLPPTLAPTGYSDAAPITPLAVPAVPRNTTIVPAMSAPQIIPAAP